MIRCAEKVQLRMQQSGAVMIVVLIVMTALSLLAMSSVSDTHLQLSMVRNDQLYLNAHRVALSEINAQIDVININPSNELDDLIMDLLEFDVDQLWELESEDLLGPHAGAGAYDQWLALSVACDPDDCLPPPGYSLDDATRVLRGRIQSNASLGDSGARSDQTQSFWYLLPQGITTW